MCQMSMYVSGLFICYMKQLVYESNYPRINYTITQNKSYYLYSRTISAELLIKKKRESKLPSLS